MKEINIWIELKMIWHALTKWHWTGTLTYDDGILTKAECDTCQKQYIKEVK